MKSLRFIVGALVLSACQDAPPAALPSTAPERATARLPELEAPFFPALTRTEPGASVTGAELADSDRCAKCHQGVADQWRRSVHAFASFNNPLYRASVDVVRRERPLRSSLACAGCHDPALLVDGAMLGEVDARDSRAHAGVTCQTCHRVTHASSAGNGSYVLGAAIELPRSLSKSERLRHAVSARRTPLNTVELCASCHRAFLNEASGNAQFFSGADDFGPWARSAYAGSDTHRIDEVQRQDCRGCHMPRVAVALPEPAAREGRVASHLFAGAHTLLAAMRSDEVALEAARRMLEGAVSVDIAALRQRGDSVWLAQAAPRWSAGEPLVLDVVLTNERTGHHFPGGIRDAQQTQVFAVVRDKLGQTVVESKDGGHSLAAGVVDGDGELIAGHHTHLFQSVAFDHTLAARESRLVRFGLTLPALAEERLPLSIEVIVRHRSRDAAATEAACTEASTPRGRAFAAAAQSRGIELDPCAEPPVTDIASARLVLDAELLADSAQPVWQRLLRYGRALLLDLSERAGTAEPVLLSALKAAPKDGRALVYAELARLAERQGRTQDVARWIALAEKNGSRHPALARQLAQAHLQVWNFAAAEPLLARASRAAPRDDELWALWATALGSLNQPERAYEVAHTALAAAPRNEALLRVQALSLRALSADDSAAALEAYSAHRVPDRALDMAVQCEERSALCALERRSVHVHPMR